MKWDLSNVCNYPQKKRKNISEIRGKKHILSLNRMDIFEKKKKKDILHF